MNFLLIAPAQIDPRFAEEGLTLLARAGTIRRVDLLGLSGETEREGVLDRHLPDTDPLVVAPWGRQGCLGSPPRGVLYAGRIG